MAKSDRVDDLLEWKSPAFRELVERAYQADPKKTDSDLIDMGYWRIATQLKIDHAVGRL